ncbi:chromogranin-A-like [Dendroctonus ponderosae]|nr:chromogranin-A-like [Dendroctonus ponderosae]
MKEALEQLNKTNAELVAKALAEEQARFNMSSSKRSRDTGELAVPEKFVPEEEPPASKKAKNSSPQPEREPTPQPAAAAPPPTPAANTATEGEGVDIETLLPSSVVTSANVTPEKNAQSSQAQDSSKESADEADAGSEPQPIEESPLEETTPKDQQDNKMPTETDGTDAPPKKNTKRRGKRKTGEILLDPEAVMEKKNLRSSASRSAAAAAARQQREAENAQKESENTS